MLTKQEVFDKAGVALLKQKTKSLLKGCEEPIVLQGKVSDLCAYRDASGNGNKCAAGHLILDEHYTFDLENKITKDCDVVKALIQSGVDMDQPDIFQMVRDLQRLHDSNPVEEWEHNLICLAMKYELSNEAIKEAANGHTV
jgi:hypothetical protein